MLTMGFAALILLAGISQTQDTTQMRPSFPPPGPLRIVWDLAPAPETEPFLDWLQQRGWCWGVEVPADMKDADFERVTSRNMRAIPQLHAHPETRAWHWSRRGQSTPNLTECVEKARRFAPGSPLMQMFMEDDSAGVGFSARLLRKKPKSYAKAKEMWDQYLDEAMTEVRRFPDLDVWGMIGFARSAHDYGRHGVDCVIVERSNDDIEDLQTAVAFARGASRQYGCEWGIDLSLWWGVFYGCVPDLNASLYTRHLWQSFLGGSQAYRIEGGAMHFGPEGPGTVARAVDDFGSIAKGLDRGVAETPVAVMLAENHGWMTPAYWRTRNEAWNYARIPYRQGDRGVDGIFGAAFPGSVYAMDPFPLGSYKVDDPKASPYALSCITEEFAPAPEDAYNAEPPIPFGRHEHRKAAYEDFMAGKKDPSPYRPMGDSRWGDVFDVLTTPAPQETLNRYQVLVLAGQMDHQDSLNARLKAFVEGGGILVWCAGQATPDDTELTGVAMEPELRVGRAWSWRDGPAQAEAFRYCPAKPVEGTETLASTPSGDPVVVCRKLGKGSVCTVLVPWYEAGHTPLARVSLFLLDEVIGAVQPVKVEGTPVQWLSTRGEGHRTILVSNNDGAEWKGTVTVRNSDKDPAVCKDLISNESVDFTQNGSERMLQLAVPPYGVRIVRFGN